MSEMVVSSNDITQVSSCVTALLAAHTQETRQQRRLSIKICCNTFDTFLGCRTRIQSFCVWERHQITGDLFTCVSQH